MKLIAAQEQFLEGIAVNHGHIQPGDIAGSSVNSTPFQDKNENSHAPKQKGEYPHLEVSYAKV